LRDEERIEVEEPCLLYLQPGCTAVYDNRITTKLSAILSIAKTIFIMLVLFLANFCFSKDMDLYIIKPIESMIVKIKKFSENSNKAFIEEEEKEYKKYSDEEKIKSRCCFGDKESKPLETQILDKTIFKIGSLMSLGFSEDEAKIFEKNLNENNQEEVYPLVDGEEILSLIAFCHIKESFQIESILKENYGKLINELSEIIYEISYEYCVSAVKYTSEGWILIWKIEKVNKQLIYDEGNDIISRISELAIVSIIKILLKIHKSFSLKKV
jgi:hypothetical protein